MSYSCGYGQCGARGHDDLLTQLVLTQLIAGGRDTAAHGNVSSTARRGCPFPTLPLPSPPLRLPASRISVQVTCCDRAHMHALQCSPTTTQGVS